MRETNVEAQTKRSLASGASYVVTRSTYGTYEYVYVWYIYASVRA